MIDDWQTFLAAGHRLTDYLRYQHYNSLLLAVVTDGAAIYPGQLVESPSQRDVLELYLRMFDREELVLVPELAFNAPLPAIERLLRTGAVSNGPDGDEQDPIGDLQLLNYAGHTRAEVDAAVATSAVGELARVRNAY